MSEHRQFLKSASIITVFTILSRIFGYIRDSRVAAILATGPAADAFIVAFRIPNLLRRLVGEGAISAAFIPVFTQYISAERRREAWEFANALLTVLSLLLVSLTVFGIVFSPLLVRLLAYGFSLTPERLTLAVSLNRIMFPYIILVSLSALAMGVLNSFHRFAVSAFSPVLLNLSIITASFFVPGSAEPSKILAYGVIAGGLLQVAIQVPSLRRLGWRPRIRWDLANEGLRRVAKLMMPVAFGVGIVQINVLVSGQFASFLEVGNVTAMYLADRVMELVLGGYAIAISTAVLPLFALQAAGNRMAELKETLNFSARLILLITIPSMVGLVVMRRPIIEVLFQHGEFDARSTALTMWPLLFFALGLPVLSMLKIIVPVFYALHDTRTPAMTAVVSLFVNAGLNFILIGPLQSGGLALATVIAALVNCSMLVFLFQQRHGEFGLRRIAVSGFRFAVAAALLGMVAYVAIQWPGFYAGSGGQKAFALALSIALSMAIYFLSVYFMRSPELTELGRLMRAKRAG